jgi:hypothetical protein
MPYFSSMAACPPVGPQGVLNAWATYVRGAFGFGSGRRPGGA